MARLLRGLDLRPAPAQIAAPTVFQPDALVYFRPRPSLEAFYKQYYRYARGDGKADLWRKRHAVRYATYLVAAPLILLLGWRVHKLLWLLFLPGAVRLPAPAVPPPARRAGRGGAGGDGARHAGEQPQRWRSIPVIRVVGDVAKMIGYPVGWCWRLGTVPRTGGRCSIKPASAVGTGMHGSASGYVIRQFGFHVADARDEVDQRRRDRQDRPGDHHDQAHARPALFPTSGATRSQPGFADGWLEDLVCQRPHQQIGTAGSSTIAICPIAAKTRP